LGKSSRNANGHTNPFLVDMAVRAIFFVATLLIMILATLKVCNKYDIAMTYRHFIPGLVGALVVAAIGPRSQRTGSHHDRDPDHRD